MSTETTVTDLSTVQQIAKRLHLHEQTVRKMIKTGELGHVKIGRYKLVTEQQLAAFIDARRTDVA